MTARELLDQLLAHEGQVPSVLVDQVLERDELELAFIVDGLKANRGVLTQVVDAQRARYERERVAREHAHEVDEEASRLLRDELAEAVGNGGRVSRRRRHMVLRVVVDPEPGATALASTPSVELPEEFWTARPIHAEIRRAAQAAMIAPTALLGTVLVRVACMSPWVTLPPLVGGPGSLDFCSGLIGRSGQGKSTPLAVAARYLPDDGLLRQLSLGSGEGIAEHYYGKVPHLEVDDDGKKRRTMVREQVHRSVLFTLDEGETLVALGERRGATLLSTIRSAWSGAQLGQSNGSEDNSRHLPAGSYRFGLLIGFQPAVAAGLMAETHNGTAQRWCLFSGIDPSAPDRRPTAPKGPLWAPSVHDRGEMPVAKKVVGAIERDRLTYLRGGGDEVDAHRNLLRLKVAGLLRLLARVPDGGLLITVEDWELAGMVVAASDELRALVLEAGERAAAAEDERIGRSWERRHSAEGDALTTRVAGVLGRHVRNHLPANEETGCTRRCLTRADQRPRPQAHQHRTTRSLRPSGSATCCRSAATAPAARWIVGRVKP